MLTIEEAVNARHSVRQYLDKPLTDEVTEVLQRKIDTINQVSGLHLQLVRNEPNAFNSFLAHYGKFTGVSNYIALVGGKDAEEQCGYYGEQLVLLAQAHGLNTCWVGLTFAKVTDAFELNKSEKLHAVISVGYGQTQGVAHKSKTFDEVATATAPIPEWFRKGVECALLAPTAINHQKFHFTLEGEQMKATAGWGAFTNMDLGIAKYHFEIGSGKGHEVWA